MSRYLWTRKTVAKCHAGELGHGARTKAGENLLITRLQPVEKRSTMEKRALAANATFSPPPPPRRVETTDIREGSIQKENDIAVLRLECPPPIPLHRIDLSFKYFKMNLFNISLYLSRSLRIKRKFCRSNNFPSKIFFQSIERNTRFHWGEKKKRTWSSRVIYFVYNYSYIIYLSRNHSLNFCLKLFAKYWTQFWNYFSFQWEKKKKKNSLCSVLSVQIAIVYDTPRSEISNKGNEAKRVCDIILRICTLGRGWCWNVVRKSGNTQIFISI